VWVERGSDMHEMTLAEYILQIIEEAAIAQDFTQVKTVWMEVGRLSCVEKEALRFCFSAVVDGTIAQRAKLEFIDIEGRGWCVRCECEMDISTLYDVCPACGSYAIQVVAGNEIRIHELEVE
jgi:hydrogenase nickel incorporation protein HypA/HybF